MNAELRRRPSLLERGQLLRVTLFGILLIALSAAASELAGRLLIEPLFDVPPRPSTTWLAHRLSKLADRPAQLQAELDEVKQHVGLEMTLYDRGGQLLGTNAAAVPSPLAKKELDELGRVKARFEWGRGAVAATLVDGRVQTYALFTTRGPDPWWLAASIRASAVLVVIALVSVPLARSVTAPLERLAALARKFGQGDLSVRARWKRRDEIGALAAAFDEMADRLAALREAETELLANVSHELRTPLSRMRLALELVQDGDAQAARRHLDDIAEEVVELERLLDDVVTTVRLDPSRDPRSLQLTKERLPATAPLEAAARRFSLRHPERRLVLELGSGLGDIEADRAVLQRAFDNLLDNAAKYSDAGTEVRLRATVTRERLEVLVTDEGIGIPEADLPRVFEPFFRSDRSRTRSTGGSGLGLVVAQRIVLAHGGEIHLDSVVDRGTTARVTLPVRASAG